MGQEGRGRPGGGHAGLHQTMGMYGCMSIYMDEYRRLSKVYYIKKSAVKCNNKKPFK